MQRVLIKRQFPDYFWFCGFPAVCQHASASRVSAASCTTLVAGRFLNHLFPLANKALHTIPLLTNFALGLQRPAVAQSSDGWLGLTFHFWGCLGVSGSGYDIVFFAFDAAWQAVCRDDIEHRVLRGRSIWLILPGVGSNLPDLTGSICRSWWRCQFATGEENCWEGSWTCNSKKLLPQHPHQSSPHQWQAWLLRLAKESRWMTFLQPCVQRKHWQKVNPPHQQPPWPLGSTYYSGSGL